MKINQAIYFTLMTVGVVLLAIGDNYIRKEYALSLGFILLMFSLYKMSLGWRKYKSEEEEEIE